MPCPSTQPRGSFAVKCLVLGGGGFIGANLCGGLLAAGHEVRVFEYPHVRSQCAQDVMARVEWFEGDFLNPADVEPAVAGCDAVFHLVSTSLPKGSNDNPAYDVESNLVATIRMLEAARRHGIGKVVFSSSGGTVYGVPARIPIGESHPTEPICSYGIVKLAIEKYLHLFHELHGLEYAVLRLANPYGEGQRAQASQGAVAVFLHKALRDEPIEIWGDGTVTRDYLYIGDVVSAMLGALACKGPERVFNIGSGNGLSLNELVERIGGLLGRPVRHVHRPGRQFDVPVNVLDIGRAGRHLDWWPRVPFDEGLRRTLEWIRKQG